MNVLDVELSTDELRKAAIYVAENLAIGNVDQAVADEFIKATKPAGESEGTHLYRWLRLRQAVSDRHSYQLGELSALAVCGHRNPEFADGIVDQNVDEAARNLIPDPRS